MLQEGVGRGAAPVPMRDRRAPIDPPSRARAWRPSSFYRIEQSKLQDSRREERGGHCLRLCCRTSRST